MLLWMRSLVVDGVQTRRPVGALFFAGLCSAAAAQGQSNPDELTSAPSQSQMAGESTSAQGVQGNRRLMSFVPSLALESTWTDNVQAGGGTGRASDIVTTVRPGLRFTAEGDRLKANVDYSLTRLVYARNSSLDQNQNALQATGSLEMAENFAFLDFNGNISQQTISAFGTRSGSDLTDNANRTEAAMYRLSPYVRGQLGDWAQYQARYARSIFRAKSSVVAADYDMDDVSVQLTGSNQQRVIAWSLDVNHQRQDYASGRSYASDRVRAFLTHPFTPQLSFSLIPGWESNNYVSQEKEGHTTFGGQVQWAISDRTNLSALLERRFFGQAHSVSFEHRTPRTAWRFSDSRDTTTMNQNGTVGLGSLYDLYFFQFASIEPDATRRAQLVNAFLLANGLNGSTRVDLGFLTSAVSLSRRQDASFTLIGVRDTLSFLASQSETSGLSQINTGNDDLSSSSYVRQHGFSITYSRRLTPLSTLNILASTTRARGQNATAQSSELRSLGINMSTRLGQYTTGSVGVRRSVSSNSAFSYSESALHGGLSFQF
ncbi:TIGR03016 family PEP-CTERM system-associated outer membrane protein [Pseudorhodoferax sp. Leaf274]|uniref:TIGR03016 family PEP-CTERM system-associated outer membrane protein n=1 Tax=Pseudorhodoferax sp. Leaf274 TaxID=1736318 RepID=UPI00138F9448|nr:TIGR03016 family PEP-CTERM system-associated outer membrane protein [Pseudorhodoferax sp. Leaf274]